MVDIFMKMLELVKGASGFEKSRNYFFERHQCPVSKEEEKIYMDYELSKEDAGRGYDELARFGICPHCRKIFYHTDYK